jgi:hypothetical protein
MYLDETGQITKNRTLRDVSFPLYRALIREGTNILAIRILGDPAYDVTGLYYTKPYYLDDYKIIETRQHKFLPMILIGTGRADRNAYRCNDREYHVAGQGTLPMEQLAKQVGNFDFTPTLMTISALKEGLNR